MRIKRDKKFLELAGDCIHQMGFFFIHWRELTPEGSNLHIDYFSDMMADLSEDEKEKMTISFFKDSIERLENSLNTLKKYIDD